MIAKGMTMLALLAALVLAGCGGQQPADDESASADKAKASTQATRPDGSDESQASEKQQADKESGSMAATREESGPVGDTIEIRKSWVQIRSAPNYDAPPIGLAYGNDTFDVLEQEGDWVHVKMGKRREGWIPVEATRE